MRRRYKIVRRRVINFLKFRILHIDDSPHRIALGVALGLFTAYLPPLGFSKKTMDSFQSNLLTYLMEQRVMLLATLLSHG